MMPLLRTAAPEFLPKKYKKWGRAFAKRLATNPKAAFNWPTVEKQNVGGLLREILIDASNNHCAYCDGYPLGETSLQTLDHFRPKSRYPRLALVWHNLFLSCDICQNVKREFYDRRLLKPDQPDFSFKRYFMVDFRSGKLQPNPKANEQDRARADYSIPVRCKSRLNHLRQFNESYAVEDMPYRYLYEI